MRVREDNLRKFWQTVSESNVFLGLLGHNRDVSWKTIFKKALAPPFIFLARELKIQVAGLYMPPAYGLHYIFPAGRVTRVYQDSPGIAGLNYIALGMR